MASALDYVEELLAEVGPRLAGSEKEYQASEIIAARFEDFGLPAQVEEFDCHPFLPWMPPIGFALVCFGALFSFLIPGALVFGLVLDLLGLAIVVVEMLGVNPIHRLLPTRISQNVIARYMPTGSIGGERPRKVVVLAHYDSGRGMIEAMPVLAKQLRLLRLLLLVALALVFVCNAVLLIPVLPELLVKVIRYVMLGSTGIVAIGMIGTLVNQFRPVQNGANCNASGVAALYSLAQMLSSQGSVSSASRASGSRSRRRRRGSDDPRQRQEGPGAPTANAPSQAGGNVPAPADGARPEGGAAAGVSPAAAAAARDATGGFSLAQDPEDTFVPGLSQGDSIAGNLVQVGTERRSPFVFERAPGAPPRSAQPSEEEAGDAAELQRLIDGPATADPEGIDERGDDAGTEAAPDVPDWYTAGKRKAESKKEQRQLGGGEPDVVRSRFASLPDNAERINRERAAHREGAKPVVRSRYADAPITPGEVRATLAAADGEAEGDAVHEPDAPAMPIVADALSSASQDAGIIGDERPDHSGEAFDAFGTSAVGEEGPSAEEAVLGAPGAFGMADTAEPAGQSGMPGGGVSRLGLPQPDLSGIDRQAFQVLAADDSSSKLIVPTLSDIFEPLPDEVEAVDLFQPAFDPPAAFAPAEPAAFDPPAAAAAPADPPADPADPSADPPAAPASDRLSRLQGLPEVALPYTAISQQAGIEQTEPPLSQESLFADEYSPVSYTGAFVPLASTGSMKPVGEELWADRDADDLYMPDADDTAMSSSAEYTDAGVYSDPDLMQIQDSAVRSFFGSLGERFGRRRRRDIEGSPSEWLGVDDDFDARSEGGEIGSWDNFNDEDDDLWRGGAFGGEDFEEDAQAVEAISRELLDKEVWLVALGSGELGHAGVRYFLKRHDRQLKGTLFINLLGVGAGDLCFTILEGDLVSKRTDQRLQNLLLAAAQELAEPLAPRALTAINTDGSTILSKTSRAISLIGMGEALPQHWRYKDDSVARLREDKINAASDLVLEVIKSS
jgi:hypothetical protein